MAMLLVKGGTMSLSKQAVDLKAVTIGLGWSERVTAGREFDLDASAFMLNARGRVLSDHNFVYFGNLVSVDGSVGHSGDDLTGGGDAAGDNEQIQVNLAAVPPVCERIVIVVSIYDAEKYGQNFGQVRNAFMRIVNDADGQELGRYNLAEDASTETAMVFGELYRNGDEWGFRAIGQGLYGNLRAIAIDLGVNVA